MAWLNRKAGSQTLMILKDKGIWFFNADGLVPYTSIEGTEVESYSGIGQMQLNTVFHIIAEKADIYGGLRDQDGKNVDYENLQDELSYRIQKAHQEEHEQSNRVYVPSANDALSSTGPLTK